MEKNAGFTSCTPQALILGHRFCVEQSPSVHEFAGWGAMVKLEVFRFMTMRRAAAILSLAWLIVGCSSHHLPAASGSSLAQRAEPTLDGNIAEFPRPGRVTLIDFWSTSCEICRVLMPAFQRLWMERKADGLDVVGVASDDNPGLVANQVESLGVRYPQVVDAQGAVRGDFRVNLLPHCVLIDKHGRVRLSVQGGRPEEFDRIVDAVNAALEEP